MLPVGAQVPPSRVDELIQEAVERFALLRTRPVLASSTRRRRQAQTPSQRAATPTLSLSVDEAVQTALDKNLDIVVQRSNPTIFDLQIAGLRSAYLPTVTSLIGDQRQVASPATLLTGGQRVTTTTGSIVGGVTENLPVVRIQPGRDVEQQSGRDQQFLLQLQPGFQRDPVGYVTPAAVPRPAYGCGPSTTDRDGRQPRDLRCPTQHHYRQHGHKRARRVLGSRVRGSVDRGHGKESRSSLRTSCLKRMRSASRLAP